MGRPIRSNGIRYRTHGQRVLIEGRDSIIILSKEASIAWELCDGQHTELDIINELIKRMGYVDERYAIETLKKFLYEMMKRGIISDENPKPFRLSK